MAINTGTGKEYVIGKGRLLFDAFLPGTKTGTGERYLGNSPELTQTQEQDTLDHIDADQGLNVKDDQVTIQNDLTGSFILDSIEADNLAMWFGGETENVVITAATAISEDFTVHSRGRFIQLGASNAMPSGTRKVVNIVVSKVTPGATPQDPPTLTAIPAANNFEFDLERAKIFIEHDAPGVAPEDVLRIVYDQEAVTRDTIIGRGDEIRGALRFEAHNPHGKNRDYYWPYVKITSNGDYALKGDSWQQMSFSYEALKRDDTVARVYIDSAPATSAA